MAADWASGTAYGVGDRVVPTTMNAYWYEAVVAGTSAVGEPSWPTTAGDHVVDNGVTWLCKGDNQCGNCKITNGTETVVLISPGLVIKRVVGKPSVKFYETSNDDPYHQDRKSASNVYSIEAILKGQNAYLDVKDLGDLFERKLGVGYITITLTGGWATALGSTLKVSAYGNNSCDIDPYQKTSHMFKVKCLVRMIKARS